MTKHKHLYALTPFLELQIAVTQQSGFPAQHMINQLLKKVDT